MTEASNILYPSGLVGYPAPPTGQNTGSGNAPIVVVPVVGGVLTCLTTGTYSNSHLHQTRGTIDCQFVTGVGGASRSLIIVANTVASAPTKYLELFLDTNNKLNLVHKNSSGTTIAAVTAFGVTTAAGVKFHMTYSWNASEAIDGTRFAKLVLNGRSATTWGTDPQTAWTPFTGGTEVAVGVEGLVTSDAFNGTLTSIVLGAQ